MSYTGQQKRDYDREWKANRRREWINDNGPCVDCGAWENLEVDHKDPTTKQYDPSWLWGLSKTNPKRIEELAKCVVRCSSCHLKKTQQEKTKNTHGRVRMYRLGCKCPECKEAKRLENAKRYAW